METILKLIKASGATMFFCIGLYLLVDEARVYSDMMSLIGDKLKDNEIYQQYYAQDLETISYASLIVTLFQSLEYDIMIDDTIIKKSGHTADKIDGYGIKNTFYRKSYEYDENGDIILLIYSSVS